MISRFSLTTARICTAAFSNFAIILFVASLISLAIFVFRPNTIVKAQEPQKSCPICSPDAVQTVYAPTIGLPEATKSEIVLNCRSNHVMNVTPTFYTSDGEAVVGNEIQMQPSEMRFVTIESLIPDEHRNRHEWGGMTLTYSGKTLEMWAQITLHGVDGIGSADVTFSQLLGRGTNTQEAVWYVPNGNSRTIIALGNSSSETIQTQLEYPGGQIEEISIEPFATRYIRRNDNVNSVRLTTTGPAGALKATGIVANKNQKFVSGIRFYEPKAAVQPNLFASNLVIKDRSPHMLLKNTTSQSINAQAIFRPTNGEGEPVIYEPVTINAGETKEIDLQQLKAALKNRNDLESVSVQIKNDGQPGALIGALYSTDQASKITQDIPLRDSGIKRTSTGAYPFRLDDDYSSTVYINNVGSQAADFNVRIWYEGGVYKLPMQKVEPGQTASYNIRKLRDEQVPDKDGNILPANVTVGQFAWSMIHITDEMKLVGRSEVISRSKKVDSSYSCPICCPNWGPVFSPLPVYVASGQNFGYYLDGFWYDCYNRDAGATSESLYAVVSDPTVASADMTTGFFSSNGYDPGQTSWSADYWLWFYQDDGMDCYNISNFANTGGPIEIPPTATITEFKAVGKGTKTKIYVSVPNNPNRVPINLSLAAKSGQSGSAKFVTNGTSTATITSSGELEIEGLTESNSMDSMQVLAKYNKQGGGTETLDTEDFTVIEITLSAKYTASSSVSSDNSALNNINSAVGRTTLGGPFLSSGTADSKWRLAIEITASITPNDFSDLLKIQRERVENRVYSDQTLVIRQVNCADTSQSTFRDDDPQSNNSQGKVYDHDAPGVIIINGSIGQVLRRRTNFRQWVTVSQNYGNSQADVIVSGDFAWYERISIVQSSSTSQILYTDVGGDNKLGLGSTQLTWDLFADSAIPPISSCSSF